MLRVESDDAEAEMQRRGADDQIRKIDAGTPRPLLTMDSPGQSISSVSGCTATA